MDANFSNLTTPNAGGASLMTGSDLLAGTVRSPLIWGSGDAGELYTITTAGVVTTIGAMGTTMYDIAMYKGALYGVDATSRLYTINTTTGAATGIANDGATLNALTFTQSGVLYAAGADTLYTVNTSTGHATAVGSGTGAGTYASSGDLVYFNGVMYLTSTPAGGGNDQLFSVNLSTGQGTLIGSLGFQKVYGLAVQNGVMYGFTDTGAGVQDILKINTGTGAGTVYSTYTLTGTNVGFYGASDDPYAPEPGPFGLVGLGLLAVVFARFRSRLRPPTSTI
jgi:hypothetical protein